MTALAAAVDAAGAVVVPLRSCGEQRKVQERRLAGWERLWRKDEEKSQKRSGEAERVQTEEGQCESRGKERPSRAEWTTKKTSDASAIRKSKRINSKLKIY